MAVPLLALLTVLASPNAAALPSSYKTVDAAAIAFVDMVREYPEQTKEYCAWLVRGADGTVHIGTINQLDMNKCRNSYPKPVGTVGSVHTHPIWGEGAKEPGAAAQMFSEGDFAHAESVEVNVPTYLGAPYGHVLRYDPGGSTCWGKSFIARRFKVVRDGPSSPANARRCSISAAKRSRGRAIVKKPYANRPWRETRTPPILPVPARTRAEF